MQLLYPIITLITGLILGMSLQWRRSEAYIKRVDKQVVELRLLAAKLQSELWAPMFEEDNDDWDEQDQFDMDEQLARTGSVN